MSAYLLHYIKALASYTILPLITLRKVTTLSFRPLREIMRGYPVPYILLLNFRLPLSTDSVYLSLVQDIQPASTLEHYLFGLASQPYLASFTYR